VVFDPLSAHQLLGVAALMAHELNDRLKSKNITLKTTDNALQYAVSQVGLVLLYNTRCPAASGRELCHSPRGRLQSKTLVVAR
jgi:ATP-dependent Clp protease ATP-binding subunit ClpA